MGLDMYLVKKLSLYGESKCTKIEIPGITINASDISEISLEVLYWRKSNQIHNWFVENVQNGEDNCAEYYVSEEQLKELLSTIKKVLKDKKLAIELLPISNGFFFGSSEYDDYYWNDLKETKNKLTHELVVTKIKQNDIFSYYYQSSW